MKTGVIVLAGGKGTRLAGGEPSEKPKVLYPLAGRPMILYTLETLSEVGFDQIILVIGHKYEEIQKLLGTGYDYARQEERLGTGHAFKIGLEKIRPEIEVVVSMYGDDSAFYEAHTINSLLKQHRKEGNAVTFMTTKVDDPTGLGRIVRQNGKVFAIVEEKVADESQKQIKEINTGLYAFDRRWVENAVTKIKKNILGEYFLTDLIEIALAEEKKVATFELLDPSQWQGVNTPEELSKVDKLMKEKLRHAN